VVVLNGPPGYVRTLGPLPEGVRFEKQLRPGLGFADFFTKHRAELEKQLPQLRRKLADTGTLWVSWPKKSAGVPTDVTEDVVRAVALPLGLVDTKVCAVDEIWSGLKLMVRIENRKSTNKK
jgi:hypothetical protein